MKSSRPNVLLITLDQWRADCLSAMGHPCLRTPHLDRLAADGVLFRRHYTQASPCGPARASLLTGLYAHNHRSVRNGIPLDDRHSNLARELRKAGYDPVLFGYTDTAVDPRLYPRGDPALDTYEGVLPGFTPGLVLWTRPHLRAAALQSRRQRNALSHRCGAGPSRRQRPGLVPPSFLPAPTSAVHSAGALQRAVRPGRRTVIPPRPERGTRGGTAPLACLSSCQDSRRTAAGAGATHSRHARRCGAAPVAGDLLRDDQPS